MERRNKAKDADFERSLLTDQPEWQALLKHHDEIQFEHMRDWFKHDKTRFMRFSLQFDELLFDYSRNRIQEKTLKLLFDLAKAANLDHKIQELFSGQPINKTEQRPALHTALRDKNHTPVNINGVNIANLVHETLEKMGAFTDKIHNQTWRGITGKPIRYIVNISIGGSYLGPMMGIQALKDFAVSNLEFHFISSVDKTHLHDVLQQIDPEASIFIISSKSFTTLETMTNAHTILHWLKDKLGDNAKQHVIAITAMPQKAQLLHIPPENIFPIWEWVGGRYSIWSAIGLPLMLMIGVKQFKLFLEGAFQMDEHFKQNPFEKNIPVLLALISIWYLNFFHAKAQAIVPYSERLNYLPHYLQQAEMESNGKSINLHGSFIQYATSPVIFGGEGCNGQHAYYQLLHQGQHFIPIDFILIAKTFSSDHHQDILVASCLSQAQALMSGKTLNEAYDELCLTHSEQHAEKLASHLVIPGNRPSNILFFDCLSPKNLGMLLALYEHKIFVQAAIWNINSFDQWGVELGKKLLPSILQQMQEDQIHQPMDSATMGLMNHFKKLRGTDA